MKYAIISLLWAVPFMIACNNDPMTNAGYFDDDTDNSVDQSIRDDHSEHNTSTTYNIDQSQHTDNSTTITTVVDSVMVIRDTFYVDSYDTVHIAIKDTTRDTIQHHIQVPVYDTITVLTADTLLQPVIDTIHRSVYVKDTVRDTIIKTVTLNSPTLNNNVSDNIIHYTDLNEVNGLSVAFDKSTLNSVGDYKIAFRDNTKQSDTSQRIYIITYYGYNNKRYVIHYRTSGSLWQYVKTNNGCINIVDIHVFTYYTSDGSETEILWANGTAVVCA